MSIKLPKIFLDSGNPEETRTAKGLLGHLEGQTTNPSLVVKNPEVQKLIGEGKKLTEKELLDIYRQIVLEISKQIAGSISIEVYADWDTTATQMLKQADQMNSWINHAHIKFPTTPEGLNAAHEFSKQGGRVNMTLVFTQEQAAAVYAATLHEHTTSPHFVSPFIGRWDDRGYDGQDLVKNIYRMYRDFNKRMPRNYHPHVEILGASIRTLDHLYACIYMGVDIVTIPMKLIQEWVVDERWMPDEHYRVNTNGLKSMVYKKLPLRKNFTEYGIEKTPGDLLDEGLKKFADDWNNLLKK
jgi:transaldolase